MPSIVEISGKLGLDTSEFDSKLDAAAAKVDSFTSKTGSSKIEIGGDAAENLEHIDDSARRAAEGIEEAGRAAKESSLSEDMAMAAEQVGVWSEQLGAFSDRAIEQASDLNEAQSAVNTVYGESASVINSFAADAAQNLGMTQSEALATSGQLGAMFQSMGLGTDQTAEMSTQLLQTAADLGSFHNAMPTEAMDALRSGLIGEAEPLRRFGILLSSDAVEAKALAAGITQQGEEMTEAQKVQARYLLIMDQLGAAQGDFARTSDGVANATRIQQAASADLQAQIGQGLLPLQLQQMQLQAKLLGSLNKLPPAFIQVGAQAAFAAGNAAPFIATLSQMSTLGPAFASALKGAGGAAVEFAKSGQLASAAFSPLGIVLAAVAVGIVAYQTNFLGFADLINGTVIPAIQAAIGVFGSFADYIRDVVQHGDPLNDFLANLPASIQPFALALGTAIEAVQEFTETFRSLFDSFQAGGFDPITSALAALNTMFPVLNGVLETAYDVWINLKEAIEGVAAGLQHAWEALQAGNIGEVMAGLGEAASAAIGNLLDILGTIGGAVVQAFQAINWDAVGGAIQTGLQTLGQWFLDAFNAIDWNAVAATINAGIQGVSNTILTWVADQGQKILNAFNAIDWISLAGIIGNGIANAIMALGDFTGFLAGKGAELLQGFINDLQAKWPDISVWITAAVAQLPSMFGEMGGMLLAKGGELIGGLLQGITGKWPEVDTWLAGMGPDVLATVGDFGSILLTKGEEIIASLKAGIDGKWPEVDSWLAALPQDIVTTVGDFASILLSKGEEIIASLKAGIDAKWPEVDAWLAALPQDIMDTVGSLASTLLDKGTELLNGLYTGALDFWNNTAGPWIQSIPQLITDAVGSLISTLLPQGQETINGLHTGMLDFWNNTAGPWVQSLPQLIVAAIGDLVSLLLEKGQQVINGLYTGMLDFWNNTLGPWVQNFGTMLQQAFPTIDLSSVGSAILDTLFSGLKSKWDEIYAWWTSLSLPTIDVGGGIVSGAQGLIGSVQATAQNAADTFNQTVAGGAPQAEAAGSQLMGGAIHGMQRTAQIRSPSKVTQQIGNELVEGAVIGIDEMAPDAELAMIRVGNRVMAKLEEMVASLKAFHGDNTPAEIVEVANSLETLAQTGEISAKEMAYLADVLRAFQGDDTPRRIVDIAESLDKLAKSASTAGEDLGEQFPEEAAKGVRRKTPEVESATKDMAVQAERGAQDTLKTGTPASSFTEMGTAVPEDFATGVREAKAEARKAMKELTDEIKATFKDAMGQMRTTIRDAITGFWDQRMTETPEFFESIEGMTKLAVDAARSHVDKLKAYVSGTQLKIQWIEEHMPTEGTAEYAAALQQINDLRRTEQSQSMEVTAAMADESIQQIKSLKDQIKAARNPARRAALEAQLRAEQRELGLVDQLAAAQNELALASTDAAREVAQIKIDSITAQLSDLRDFDPAALFDSLATSVKDAMTKAKADLKALGDEAKVQAKRAHDELSTGITSAMPEAEAGIASMAEPMKHAADGVTAPVISSFANMRDQVEVMIDDMITAALAGVKEVDSITSDAPVSRDTGDDGDIRVRDRGGHGKNADGGTFTHGDIDEGANVDVDVSGGKSVERDGGHGGRGGDIHIKNVNVRDDRHLKRWAKDEQRRRDLSHARGK